MTEGTQPQEIKEVPQETKEVAEARQELDKATLEPESAMEKVAPEYQQAEEVEAALKEAVQAASAQTAAADGRPGTEDRTVVADAKNGDSTQNNNTSVPTVIPGKSSEPEAVMGDLTDIGGPKDSSDESSDSDHHADTDESSPGSDGNLDPPNSDTEENPTVSDTTSDSDQDSSDEGSDDSPLDTDSSDGSDDDSGNGNGDSGEDSNPESSSESDSNAESTGKSAFGEPAADPSLDLSASTDQETATISGTGPMAAQNPLLSGSGAPPAAGLGTDEEVNDQVQTPARGGPTSDPARSYSGVEMAQGEVLQDGDWNEGSLDGPEPEDAIPAGEDFDPGGAQELKERLAPFRNNLGALRQMVADLANADGVSEARVQIASSPTGTIDFNMISAAAEVAEGGMSLDTLDISGEVEAQEANIDLQNILQKQQQYIQMMSQLSQLMHDTENAVIRKMSGGEEDSNPPEGQQESESEATQEGPDREHLTAIDQLTALQDAQQELQNLVNLSQTLEDPIISEFRNISDGESDESGNDEPAENDPDQGELERLQMANYSNELQLLLQFSMKKQAQALQILSNIMKAAEDGEKAIIKNMKGEDYQPPDPESAKPELQMDVDLTSLSVLIHSLQDTHTTIQDQLQALINVQEEQPEDIPPDEDQGEGNPAANLVGSLIVQRGIPNENRKFADVLNGQKVQHEQDNDSIDNAR